MSSNDRGLRATRMIFAAKGEGEPLQYLWAIGLERDETQHERLLFDIAEMIARNPDPAQAIKDIVESFLVQPREDAVPDGPEPRMALQREASSPMPALAPGSRDESKAEIGPDKSAGNDSRRSVAEVCRAAKLLGLAVRLLPSVADQVAAAATLIKVLSQRTRGDASAKAALQAAADGLAMDIKAKGTLTVEKGPSDIEDQVAVDEAMRAGVDPDAVLRFRKQWRHLRSKGLAGPSIERYVDINMAKLP